MLDVKKPEGSLDFNERAAWRLKNAQQNVFTLWINLVNGFSSNLVGSLSAEELIEVPRTCSIDFVPSEAT